MLANTLTVRSIVKDAVAAVDSRAYIDSSNTSKRKPYTSDMRDVSFLFVFADAADVLNKVRSRLKELGYTNKAKVVKTETPRGSDIEYLRVTAVLQK